MKKTTLGLKAISCAVLMSLALSACGSGGNSAESASAPATPPVATPGATPPPVASTSPISAAAVAVIDERYSSAPDLKSAAMGFATAAVTEWQAASRTGVYDEKLALQTAHSQFCLSARAERLGKPITQAELIQLVGALTSTPELFAAMRKADSLQSGHPMVLSSGETQACAKAGSL
jgi:hypothetical protein